MTTESVGNGSKGVLDIHDRPSPHLWLVLSVQHLFAMFGATVLVPILTGLSPAVALVTSGLGTLLYMAVTGFRIPVYLGSSFAFIAPIIAGSQMAGVPGAMLRAVRLGKEYGTERTLQAAADSQRRACQVLARRLASAR